MSNPGETFSWRPKPKAVRVVCNPATAKRTPILGILNNAFRRAGIYWNIDITHGDGDGQRLARKAIEEGADLIATFGGDGTVMEAASAVIGTEVPLLILGGGTGNLVASELRLPGALEKACELVCSDRFKIRTIDVGLIGERPFLLRAGCGLETLVVQDATREMKDHFGKWAYVFAGVKALQEGHTAEYEVIVDGEEVASGTGVACVIANSGRVGLGRLNLSPDVDIDDGKLDVFFLKKANIEGIAQLAGKMMGLDQVKLEGEPLVDASHLLSHWTAERIEIHTDPIQDIQADGDVIAKTPMIARIEPASLQVVVPGRHD